MRLGHPATVYVCQKARAAAVRFSFATVCRLWTLSCTLCTELGDRCRDKAHTHTYTNGVRPGLRGSYKHQAPTLLPTY